MVSTAPTTVSPEHLDFQIVHPWVGKLCSQLLLERVYVAQSMHRTHNAGTKRFLCPIPNHQPIPSEPKPGNSSTTIQLIYHNKFWLILNVTALKGLNQRLQKNRKCIYQSHPDHFKQVWSPKAQEYSNATTLCPVSIGVWFLFTDRKPLTRNRLTQQWDKHSSILALTHPNMVAKSPNSCFIVMCRLLYWRQCYAHSAHCLP